MTHKNQHNHSLRKRLLLCISVPLITAALISTLIGFLFSWHEVEEVYDAQMAHSAKLLFQITTEKNKNLNLGKEIDLLRHKYEGNMTFRIWNNDHLITRSWNTDDFTNIQAPPGFSDISINNEEWRFFVFIDDKHEIQVEVAQKYEIRYELILQLMISLIAPWIIFIPIIFAIIWIGVRKSLKPLVKISSDVNDRSSNDLSSIDTRFLPTEITPLIDALNALFMRIEETFKKEREFTDHASHELRTPLAAMKTQTQVLLKKANISEKEQQHLTNLEMSIDRASHLVHQLLSLARLQNGNLPYQEINLTTQIESAISAVQNDYKQKDIKVDISLNPNIFVKGEEDSLYIMIKNLLDNAIKYTPFGGSISIVLKDHKLQITDTGTGIAESDKKQVFERFYRADKTGQIGSGLGLAIVKWVADTYDIRITLKDNKPSGLSVELTW